MTTMTRVTAAAINSLFQAAAAGDVPGKIVTPATNDLIPISSGRGTLLIVQTTGTTNTLVIKNVVAPPYGTGGDVTLTLAATDLQTAYISNDGAGRFDQGGANVQYAKLTFGTSPATGMTIWAVAIPA
jgi:hypothetical protein